MSSQVTTNEAHSIATNWLARIDVDVNKLELAYRPSTIQRFYYERPDADLKGPRKNIPVFDVIWGVAPNPAVIVTIFGPTKEPIEISQNDVSFSMRPKDLVTNIDLLLKIPDRDFEKLSESSRADLLAKTLAVVYPPAQTPVTILQTPSAKKASKAEVLWKTPTKPATNTSFPGFKK